MVTSQQPISQQMVQGPVPSDTTHPMREEKENEAVEVSSKFTLTIENFSQQTNKHNKLYSKTFVVDGYKWRVLIFPKGNKVDHLSSYLTLTDYSALPNGWNRNVHFTLTVVNQMHNKLTMKRDAEYQFDTKESNWGFRSFMPVTDLYDPSKGFLVNDTVIIRADVAVRKTEVKGKRKRNDTPSEKQSRTIEYGENLVGSRIKIWWPDDQVYYHGVVKSFNSMQKKHELLYDDGEKELSNLKTEKWVLVKNVSSSSKSDCLKPPLTEKVPLPQSDIIRVQGYKVKNSVATVLEAVFKKYGDIASDCVFKPASTRSSLLESVCEVVMRIERSDVKTIVLKMEELESQVSALEGAKINVSWLRAHLEAIQKRKEAKKNSSVLMETKTKTVLVKRAAEMDLIERRAAFVDAQEQFRKAEKCVRVLDLVEKKLSNNILEAKAEKDSWVKRVL